MSQLVGSPEDRFSRVEAHIITKTHTSVKHKNTVRILKSVVMFLEYLLRTSYI